MIRNMWGFFFFLLLGFAYVGYRLYVIQIERHDELFEKAKKRYTTTMTRKGTRGEIFDLHGNILVCNVPVQDILCDPSIVGDAERCRELAALFAKETGADEKTIYQRMMNKDYETKDKAGNPVRRPRLYAVIARKVELNITEKLEKIIKERKYKGIWFEDTYYRTYPKDEMLANILGVTSMDQDNVTALAGLEVTLNEEMQSGESTLSYERMLDGRRFSYGNMEGDPVQDGCNVFLTIQEPIQAIMEEELDLLMERVKAKKAYGLMINPRTGDIMAMAQRPTFNPNDRSVLVKNFEALRNDMVQTYFEPGSVMKTFTMAYALDRGFVTPDTEIDCMERVWKYKGSWLHDTHPVRKVPAREIIKQSSNIGTAKIAVMMGKNRLYEMLRLFGFGQRTGIPLTPESCGNLRKPEKWDGLSITRFCIGQGVGVTALQLARAYCMIANGGYPVKLRLVDRVDRNGITEKYAYERGKCIFQRADTAEEIRRMLVSVTEPGGTGTKARIPGFFVAGKTGTAEKFQGKAYQDAYMSSFCGFVPSKDPEFVLLITCDEPEKGTHHGGAAAGPAFAAIAERTLKYLHVPNEVPMDEWNAHWKAMQKIDYARRVKEDERVRARRAARDAKKK